MAAVAQEARRGLPGRPVSAVPACATFYCTVGGNDVAWRAEFPAEVLGAKVAKIPENKAQLAFEAPNRSTPMPWRLHADLLSGDSIPIESKAAYARFYKSETPYVGLRAEFPQHEGAAVFTRPDIARATLARAMSVQHGVRTLAEVDDNYFADSSKNLVLRYHQAGDDMRMAHAKATASMDGIVVSTHALRRIYGKELRARFGKRIPEFFVCRNHIPRSMWPERIERDGRVRVGFMGSMSHVWDVNLAYAAFHAAHTDGHDTVMIGYNPGDPDPNTPDEIDTPEGPVTWRSDRSIDFRDSWRRVINTEPIGWIDPGKYHRAALPLDVGLCPLRVDSFTLGKSDVKCVEYAISGAAIVCQNMPVYTEGGWKHEVNCLMAGSPEEFAYATLRLCRDHKLRYELVTAAQEMVANERNEIVLEREWREALDG